MKRPIASYIKITTKHGEPVKGSQYGKHIGTDYSTPANTVVVAPVGGKIASSHWSNAVGNVVEIDGDDGRRHRILHLNRRDVATGARVSEGQQIGLSGSTGSTSTGAHVHWDARKGGTGYADGFGNYYDTEALYQESIKPKPTPPATGGKRLYFDPIGQTATFYPVKGGTYAMKIKDSTFNWNVLKNEGNRVLVNSKSAGGDCWVYLKYTATGKTIPGRYIK